MNNVFIVAGPLLPEKLDVRGIPFQQGRQLTIALSGETYLLAISVHSG